jgi:hypothetical protein
MLAREDIAARMGDTQLKFNPRFKSFLVFSSPVGPERSPNLDVDCGWKALPKLCNESGGRRTGLTGVWRPSDTLRTGDAEP